MHLLVNHRKDVVQNRLVSELYGSCSRSCCTRTTASKRSARSGEAAVDVLAVAAKRRSSARSYRFLAHSRAGGWLCAAQKGRVKGTEEQFALFEYKTVYFVDV